MADDEKVTKTTRKAAAPAEDAPAPDTTEEAPAGLPSRPRVRFVGQQELVLAWYDGGHGAVAPGDVIPVTEELRDALVARGDFEPVED